MAAKNKVVQPAESSGSGVPAKNRAASSASNLPVFTGQPLTTMPQSCPSPTPSVPAQWPFGGVLWPGHRILPGSYLASSNGRYQLHWQDDGNLVFTDAASGKCSWCSDTPGIFPDDPDPLYFYCEMQGDGNFVMHARDKVVFQTDTPNHPGAFLLVSEDGNVAIIDQNDPNFVIWHRGIMGW